MSFDPYYKWLGIPPDEQPPSHYRLLGLTLFEQNIDAIDNAGDRQMAHVRTFQAGPQGAHSQQLLNEIAAARMVLLDPAKKRAYDEQLRAQRTPHALPVQTATPMVVEIPAAAPAIQVQPRESSATTRRPSKDMTVEILKIIGGGIAGIVLATVLLRLGFGIDMTGMFPVSTPEPQPNVVKKPKPVEKKTSSLDPVIATPAIPKVTPSDSAAGEMEEYEEPTPSGVVKKKKRKKGKTKANPASAASNGAAITVARMTPIPIEVGPKIIPELRGGTRFDWLETPTAVNVDLGRLEFTVQNTGWVYLVADWSYEGNDSGDWKNEAKSKDQLISEGWDHLGPCPWSESVDKPLELFRKVCKEGETYTIRVNKYWPPLAFVPPAASSPQVAVGPPVIPSANPTADRPSTVTSATLVPRRLLPPPDAERQAAEQQLEQVYQLSKLEDDAAKLAKASELLALGRNRQTRPAERWTTLKKAAELAADGADARTVAQALDVLAQAFETDPLAEEAVLLAKSGRGVRTAEQMDALVAASRVAIHTALAEQQYTLARDLAAAVREAASRPAGAKYRKFIYDGQKEIVRQQKEWYDCQTELAKLAAKPDDPIAAANAARWWVLERGDWDGALPYLSKAGDPLLRTAVGLDQAKGPNRLAIANAWYDAGKAGDGNPLWLVRAKDWYLATDKSQVSGLDGALLDQRLEELRQNAALQPLIDQINRGRGATRASKSLAPVVRRHCMLLMPFEPVDHFHDGKNWMVSDRSGQFNHGVVNGPRPAPGQAGTALDFDGTDDFVECPDQPSLNPTEAITVCAWVRQHSVINRGGADDIVSKEEWGGGTGRGYSLRLYEVRPNFNFGNGPDWLWVQAPQSVELDMWYHLAAIYDGQNQVLLVNGTEAHVQPTNKTISVSPQPLRIGRGSFAQDRRFHGLIDEVAVFDMALTAADLQAIIDLGRAGKSLAE
jgi:hypothetical protein